MPIHFPSISNRVTINALDHQIVPMEKRTSGSPGTNLLPGGPSEEGHHVYHLILKFISGNDFPHRKIIGESLIIHEKQPKVLVIW